MEYFELIKKRYSVRSYKSDSVEAEKLKMILEAAALAPTACNRQAFRVVVLKTEGRKDELKKIYRADWFAEAPLILCVCSIPGEGWTRSDGKSYSDVDAAIVMDHIILAATDLDLGTCWIGAFDARAAKKVLALDDTMELVACTPLGYPNCDYVNRSKKSADEIVIYR